MNGLRELGDNLKREIRRRCYCPCFPERRKSILSCHGNRRAQEARSTRLEPDQAIAGCVGGGGGGRPNMAQAGGKNPAGIPEAVAKVKEILESQIS